MRICHPMLILFAATVAMAENPTLHLPQRADRAVVSGFRTTDGQWSGDGTSVAISRNADRLLLEFDCRDSDAAKLPANCRTADSEAIFGDEVVEIFLSPASGRYYHLAVNPAGTLYSAECNIAEDGARTREVEWNPTGIDIRTTRSKTGWHATLSIPFEAFGANQADQQKWQANFARTRAGKTRSVSSWTGSPDFNDPRTFGTITFAPARQLHTQLRHLAIAANKISAELIAISDREQELTLALIYRDQEQQSVSAKLEPGKPAQLKLAATLPVRKLPLKDTQRLTLKLTDKSGKILWERHGTILFDTRNAIRLDRYYYHPGADTLRYSLDLPEHVNTVRVEILRNGELRQAIPNASATGSLELTGLPSGRYQLRVIAGDSEEELTYNRVFFLTPIPEYPKFEEHARLTRQGNALYRGKTPIFLLSGSPTPKHYLSNDDAFNLRYGTYGVCEDATELLTFPGGRFHRENGKPGYVFAPWEQHAELLRTKLPRYHTANAIARIAYEAQMAAWFSEDGKQLQPQNPAQWYRRIAKTARECAPNLLTSIHIDKPDQLSEFRDIGDILEAAFWSSSYATNIMAKLNADQQSMRQAVPDKPLIFWLGGTVRDCKIRTAEEIRGAVYLSILNGFAGNIIHMGHGFLPQERSRLWSVLSRIGPEVNTFYGTYRTALPDNTVTMAIPPKFCVGARTLANGDTMLIAVNCSGYDRELALPLQKSYSRLSVPQEHRREALTGNVLTDSFTAFEPKVYMLER